MGSALNAQMMADIQKDIMDMLAQRHYDTPETIFGLGELVGRLIAKQTKGTWIEKQDIMEAVVEHMATSVRVGCNMSAVQESRIILPH